jgi:hypothetical protein
MHHVGGGNLLVTTHLEKQGYKDNIKINLREVWGTDETNESCPLTMLNLGGFPTIL